MPVVAAGARPPAKWTGDHLMGIRAHIRGGGPGAQLPLRKNPWETEATKKMKN